MAFRLDAKGTYHFGSPAINYRNVTNTL